ncbi:hypothetical protein QYE76_037095 [Lolium multiflorum]|uniref:DUF4378 domain-containing protein n=1 Tax=Lolium multiflorum TaxID=4521 RepID=A0AAD8VQH9_LOLMU|nr:hypothetical protein QYE76_037013 [Lolium multiflorum]KAK1613422.1 hypothetical protein QYE76_037095 [Lolium multiflorum]
MLGQPSVIARLMGLEDAIVAAMPAIPAAVMVQAEEDSMVNLLKPSSKLKRFKCSPLPYHGRISGDYYRYCLNKMKPRRRSSRRSTSSSSSSRGHHRRDHDRHPQEDLLEKIKEEFRASWQQASMTPENENAAVSSASASGRMSSADRAEWVDGRYIQKVAQENLRREKMARYGHGANGKTKVDDEDEEVETVVAAPMKAEEAEQEQQGGSEVASAKDEGTEERFMEEGTSSDSHRAESEEFLGSLGAVVNGDPEHDEVSSTSGNSRGTPTRIAILRPVGTTRAAGDHRDPAFGTPPPSWKATRDGGMEEFLRAVKERLNNEMKAKTGSSDVEPPPTTTRKLWGSDDPELAARDTAKRIREAAGMAKEDLGRRLSRLESFRVFRGDRSRRDAAAVLSPEHRMLKRVRARIEAMSPKKTKLSGSSSPVSSRGGRVWSSPPADAGHASSLSGIGSDDEQESGCRGDRQRLMTRLWKAQSAARMDADTDTNVVVSPLPSPHALVRSFSAPASSGISSGAEVKLSRSRSFSLFRGTMASGISLGGKLLTTADFLAGLAPPSPVSPLEVHGRSPRHFAESSPRRSPRCSTEFEASVVGGESPWRWKIDAASESDEDPDKAYVRELLIAAGLFDDNEDGVGRPWEDTAAVSTDSMAGPMIMSDDVFDEVEDAYYYRRRVDEDCSREEEDEWLGRRRLLFDMANEALQALQAGPSSSSLSLCRWIVESGSGVSSSRLWLRGSELEEHVWRRVARAMTGDDDAPAPATTVDGMVEREVDRSPWMVLREDVCAVGRKVERAIFDELVGEVLRQVFVRT